MKELLVGTRKGLFVLRGDGPGAFEIVTSAQEIESRRFAMSASTVELEPMPAGDRRMRPVEPEEPPREEVLAC